MSNAMKSAPVTAGTTFRCNAPDAESVFVAGGFNSWSTTATPLRRDGGGQWSAPVDLPQGRHEFKFLVDGRWCCEPGCDGPHRGCPGCAANAYGTMNRVIEVGEEAELRSFGSGAAGTTQVTGGSHA